MHALALLLGLLLGNLLPLVITRLPRKLSLAWQAEAAGAEHCHQTPKRLTQCFTCGAAMTWYRFVPLVGWLRQVKGRTACNECSHWMQPLIELASASIALTVFMVYGLSGQGLFILTACLVLLVLAAIDMRTFYLPDALTLPLLWAGLLYQIVLQSDMLTSAVLGAMAGYLILWSVYWVFKLATGKEGMGYGDFKLLAALGAWLGWEYLPIVMILSAGVGAILTLVIQLLLPHKRDEAIPFGPFLAGAGMIALIGGEPMIEAALQLMSFLGSP